MTYGRRSDMHRKAPSGQDGLVTPERRSRQRRGRRSAQAPGGAGWRRSDRRQIAPPPNPDNGPRHELDPHPSPMRAQIARISTADETIRSNADQRHIEALFSVGVKQLSGVCSKRPVSAQPRAEALGPVELTRVLRWCRARHGRAATHRQPRSGAATAVTFTPRPASRSADTCAPGADQAQSRA